MGEPPLHRVVILDAHVPEDHRRWISVWRQCPSREVFAHPAYVELEADSDRTRARAAILETDDGTVLYPFLQRRLDTLSCWTPDIGAASDITAPYGYGGPNVWGATDRDALAAQFWDAFDLWAMRERIVSEFVRFSLFADSMLPYRGEREERQANVVRSLTLPIEAIWMDFEHKVRKNVKKAQRSALHIVHDEGERLEAFLDIYAHTMDRRTAHDRYYFPREYFLRLQQQLPGQFRYFHAVLDGRVVSTELVLISENSVYSFLGGTRDAAFEHRPNDLLKHAIITWAQEQGKENFVLGGGVEPEDGIFRYKLAFAPEGRCPFFVGTRILLPELYERLRLTRLSHAAAEGAMPPRPGYFPAYRG